MKSYSRNMFIAATLLVTMTLNAYGRKPVSVGIVMHAGEVSDNRTGENLAAKLKDAGFSVEQLDYDRMIKNIPAVDFLVIAEGCSFPLNAADRLHSYLKKGGSVVSLGGDPFAEPVVKYGSEWLTKGQLHKKLYNEDSRTVVADPANTAPGAWVPYRTNKSSASNVQIVEDTQYKAFKLEYSSNLDVDEFRLPVKVSAGSGSDAILFYTKASGVTPQAMLRLRFGDERRYEYVIDLTPGWNAVCIPLDKLVPTGKTKQTPASLDDLTDVTFAMSVVRHRFHDHDIFVSAIKGVKLPEGYDNEIEQGDFVLCLERDIYRYDDGVEVSAPDGSAVDFRFPTGDFKGISALGFPVYGDSFYMPLLEVKDRHGRRRGWGAGMVVNKKGEWAGSNWIIFGIENNRWYDSDQFCNYLARLLLVVKAGGFSPAADRLSDAPEIDLPKISIKDGHFIKEDGSPLFIVGENLGSLLYDRSLGRYDEYSLDRMFCQLHHAGINALRILNITSIANSDDLHLLSRAAEKWGVYLLIGATPGGKHGHSKTSIEAYAAKLSRGLSSSPALLGYDLKNEPYIHEIGSNLDGDGVPLSQKYPFPKKGMADLVSSLLTAEGHGTSTFYGFDNCIPRPSEPVQAKAYDAVDGMFSEWIGWYRDAFEKLGDKTPLTVGFNMWFAALPVGGQVDFLNQHTYVFPTDIRAVRNEITVMDRLHKMFPDKPVTLGEFGYTSGYILDGRPLSSQCQALGEMIHLLYAWSQGYDGVFDWQVYDFDPVNYPRIAVWNRDRFPFKQNYEKYHGIYAWDGTHDGILKPYGMATRFFSEAVACGLERGKMDIYQSDTQIGTGYKFSAPGAIFVGGRSFSDEVISFTCAEERNIGMFSHANTLSLMSTGDVTLTIDLSKMECISAPLNAVTEGLAGDINRNGSIWSIELLAGEKVMIR